MKISRPRSLSQLGLFYEDETLVGPGHVRCVIGELIERLTAEMFGGARHKTDCTCDYCPDISTPSGIYFETKAVGRSKAVFVYTKRLEKDRVFAEDHSLFYVIWHHRADTKQARTIDELRALVLSKLQDIYVCPFKIIDSICSTLEPEKLNGSYGKRSNAGLYGYGYRFGLKQLNAFRMFSWKIERQRHLFI